MQSHSRHSIRVQGQQKQALKTEQTFRLQPKLLAGQRLLTLPIRELRAHIAHELEENVFLEEVGDSVVTSEGDPKASLDAEHTLVLEQERLEDQLPPEEQELIQDPTQPFDENFPLPSSEEDFSQSSALSKTETSLESLSSKQEDFRDLHELRSKPSEQASTKSVSSILEETAVAPMRVEDDLMLQAGMVYNVASPHYRIAEMLISALDENGFLPAERLEDLRVTLDEEADLLVEVLAVIKTFSPAGIGAKDTKEALSIQVERLLEECFEDETPVLLLAQTILDDHFSLMSAHKLDQLTQTLGVTREEIDEAFVRIAQLELKPLRAATSSSSNGSMGSMGSIGGMGSAASIGMYAEPDATIEISGERLVLTLENDYAERLRLSPRYQAYLKEMLKASKHALQEITEKDLAETDTFPKKRQSSPNDGHSQEMENDNSKSALPDEAADFKAYLITHKQKAEDLIDNLKYRKSNFEKVLTHLLIKQREFFFKGFSELKPYALIELAADLKMDKGTISRVISGKWIHAPWGMVELRRLFSSSKLTTTSRGGGGDGGTGVTPAKLQMVIREIIEAYPEKRLSDQKISDMLKQRGMPLARRTVSKYRQQMNLLSSIHRK